MCILVGFDNDRFLQQLAITLCCTCVLIVIIETQAHKSLACSKMGVCISVRCSKFRALQNYHCSGRTAGRPAGSHSCSGLHGVEGHVSNVTRTTWLRQTLFVLLLWHFDLLAMYHVTHCRIAVLLLLLCVGSSKIVCVGFYAARHVGSFLDEMQSNANVPLLHSDSSGRFGMACCLWVSHRIVSSWAVLEVCSKISSN